MCTESRRPSRQCWTELHRTESREGGEVMGHSFHSYKHRALQYRDQRWLRGVMGKMRGEALLPCSSEAIQSHGYHGYYGHHHNITTVPRLEKHAAPFWVSLLAASVKGGKETRKGRRREGGWRLKIRSLSAACRRWWELWSFGPVCWTSITFTNTNLFILTSSFSFCSFSPH